MAVEVVPSPATESAELARSRRAYMEVDLGAIGRNLVAIRRAAGGARVMAVVKGDAYGTGAKVVAPFLQACGTDALAVDNVAEGVALREAGVTLPIMVIDGDVAENAELAVRHDLVPGIPHEALLDAYAAAARSAGRTLPVWLLVNVGFNRSGHRRRSRFEAFVERAGRHPDLRIAAVYAHMTDADGDREVSAHQIEDFTEMVAGARRLLGRRVEASLFATHGLLRWGATVPTDWVRPGLLLYGEHFYARGLVEPETLALAAALRPALALRARVTALLDFDGEEGVGYGRRQRTRPGQRLATLAFGFGSGYPNVAGGLWALAAGRRVPVFGHPGMDAMQVDVTEVPELRLYDWVTLLGPDGDDRLSLGELARAAGTSPYQLLSTLGCARLYR